jgi:hypothetical protein
MSVTSGSLVKDLLSEECDTNTFCGHLETFFSKHEQFPYLFGFVENSFIGCTLNCYQHEHFVRKVNALLNRLSSHNDFDTDWMESVAQCLRAVPFKDEIKKRKLEECISTIEQYADGEDIDPNEAVSEDDSKDEGDEDDEDDEDGDEEKNDENETPSPPSKKRKIESVPLLETDCDPNTIAFIKATCVIDRMEGSFGYALHKRYMEWFEENNPQKTDCVTDTVFGTRFTKAALFLFGRKFTKKKKWQRMHYYFISCPSADKFELGRPVPKTPSPSESPQ